MQTARSTSSLRLALVGDVHLAFGPKDVASLDAGGYDLVLFVGDLAGYSFRGALRVARYVAQLRTPTIVMPGNHDCITPQQMLAEIMGHEPTIGMLTGGEEARVTELRRALAPAILTGYGLHPLPVRSGPLIDLVTARPHSFGGPVLSFRPYLERAHGISTLEASAERITARIDESRASRIVMLAHNGPSGLGARRSDIWGCDFRRGEGDFGDPDLRAAIDHARARGKHVVAVLAGHMHHALRGVGGQRTWLARDERGTLHVNAARVPRVFTERGKERRHHVEVVIDGDSAEAREVLVDGA
jgi:uncharacterized protein (TIGR04168 family)